MTVRWTQTALRDVESLHAYIQQDGSRAAGGMVEEILAGIDALERYPHMGRPGRVPGTRELVIRPYIAVYRVQCDAIELLAILHGARRWPASL